MTRKKISRIILLILVMVIVSIGDGSVDAATKIALSSESEEIPVGKSVTLSLKGATGSVKWSTSNSKVVSVNSKGRIKALKKGTAVVKATYKKKEYVCNVRVISNFDFMYKLIREKGVVNSNGYKTIFKETPNRMYSLTYIKEKKEFEFKYMYDGAKKTYLITIIIPRNGAHTVPTQVMYINNTNGSYFYGEADISRANYSKTYKVPLKVTKASGKNQAAYEKNANEVVLKAFDAWNKIIKINNLGFTKY